MRFHGTNWGSRLIIAVAALVLLGSLAPYAVAYDRPPEDPPAVTPPPPTLPPPPKPPVTPPGGTTPPIPNHRAPEPTTLVSALIGAGVMGLFGWRRRRRVEQANNQL